MNKSEIPIADLISRISRQTGNSVKQTLPKNNVPEIKQLAPPIDIPVNTDSVLPLLQSAPAAKSSKPEPEDVRELFHGID